MCRCRDMDLSGQRGDSVKINTVKIEAAALNNMENV